MHYDTTLSFVMRFLKNCHISNHLTEPPFLDMADLDYGLRSSILPDYCQSYFITSLLDGCLDHTVYYLTDSYYCSYTLMKLPEENCRYLIIGPYTFDEIDDRRFLQLTEELQFPPMLLSHMQNYYNHIPVISLETEYKALIATLAEELYQGNENYEISYRINNIWNDVSYQYDTSLEERVLPVDLGIVEQLYYYENSMMQAVSQGNSQKAELMYAGMRMNHLPKRLHDPIRNRKNYMIILNTLLRKSAENGCVHPMHLDRISSKFARKIELLTSLTQADTLSKEMVHRYCMLVNHHSLKGYSQLIQKVINQIHYDLTADLRLKCLADHFNVNASYLSTLFKKETQMTLTDYVNQKRIDHAILLLNATTMQIQSIAVQCGIPDFNYFTKIFKKFKAVTPREYRSIISQKS